MKRIHLREGQLLMEGYEQRAGTDFPCFYDEKTDEFYEANWNGDYGFPFGFWPIDGYDRLQFFVGDAWTTHANACGKAAEEYYCNILNDLASEIVDGLDSCKSDFLEYGYTYNEEYDTYVSADGSDEMDLDDFTREITDYLSSDLDYEMVYGIVRELVQGITEDGNEVPDCSEVFQTLQDSIYNSYDFSSQDGIDKALKNVGEDFYSFFERGCNQGRIWPKKEMIGFYDTEQPNPERLLGILQLLSQDEKVGVNYKDLLNYHMVFEDWRNDGVVTCCTISDYVDGNYGPDSYEDEDNDEEEVQYARQGKTKFVPHLASPEQKRSFFKDFRDTRDRAVYAPKEKAAGNLAAYHAMRYPYGENKERITQIIKEIIGKKIKERL